jgi:hypothetical protein
MFLGHVAVGLAAKKVAPKAPLVWLVAALNSVAMATRVSGH